MSPYSFRRPRTDKVVEIRIKALEFCSITRTYLFIYRIYGNYDVVYFGISHCTNVPTSHVKTLDRNKQNAVVGVEIGINALVLPPQTGSNVRLGVNKSLQLYWRDMTVASFAGTRYNGYVESLYQMKKKQALCLQKVEALQSANRQEIRTFKLCY